MFLFTWLISKFGKSWFTILKYLAIIILIASPFIYHFLTVNRLESRLSDSVQKSLVLEQNVQILAETQAKNEETLRILQNNQKFINKLEKSDEERKRQAAVKRQATQSSIEEQRKVLGDVTLTPLISEMLNQMESESDSNSLK